MAGLISAPTPYLAKIIIDDVIFKNAISSNSAYATGWMGISETVWMIFCLVGLGVFMKLLSAAINGWQCYYILNITRNGLYQTRLGTALIVIGAVQKFFENMEPARIASRLGNDVNAMDLSLIHI